MSIALPTLRLDNGMHTTQLLSGDLVRFVSAGCWADLEGSGALADERPAARRASGGYVTYVIYVIHVRMRTDVCMDGRSELPEMLEDMAHVTWLR